MRVHHPIPDLIVLRIVGSSWRSECPVRIADLAYLEIDHVDFAGAVSLGEMIVHRAIAHDVIAIFDELLMARFPIAKMRLVDDYDASDDASMEDDNTSAFNFRPNVTDPRVVSTHGYGRAIDVNPRENPYVAGDKVLPPSAARFVDRSLDAKGMIKEGDACERAFAKRGFEWGGRFKGRLDYQHFEKP